jgi:hypothetical protein
MYSLMQQTAQHMQFNAICCVTSCLNDIVFMHVPLLIEIVGLILSA